MAGGDRLIVEHLDGELLVYDTQQNEAHALSGAGAAEFAAAPDDVSRREVLRKLALAGAAAAGGVPLIRSIVAPTPAQAQTCSPNFSSCTTNAECCSTCCCTYLGIAATGVCNSPCPITFSCIGSASDRNLKRDLLPADPYRVLGLVAAVS